MQPEGDVHQRPDGERQQRSGKVGQDRDREIGVSKRMQSTMMAAANAATISSTKSSQPVRWSPLPVPTADEPFDPPICDPIRPPA